MRTLVTGATGFTGSHLTRQLLEEGYEVVGLDNQKGLFFDELEQQGAQLHLGSVTDAALLDELARGCDQIYHLAAAFRKVNLPKQTYWDINVGGTENVLRAAENQGVARVLYCSTCGVHGNVDCPPANESAPIAPADWYQETKWQGEVVCQRFLERGLWITIVRPAAIYGPGDPERFLMLYRRAAKGRFIMVGDGSTHYHPLYVTNLIEGIRRAIETESARGKAYLLADAHSIAIKDLVTKIGGVLGTRVRFIRIPYPPVYLSALACEAVYHFLPWEPPIFRRRIDWFVQNRAFDTTLARTELAYEPSVDLDRGLTLTAAWYRDHGYL